MNFQQTWKTYKEVERDPIQYTYCTKFDHLSRYRLLRQVIHEGNQPSRFVALETVNVFKTAASMNSYKVPAHLENRLDIIARDQLGSATYSWVIAYINGIEDGYTCLEGTVLQIPDSISDLINDGEILGSIDATRLNLGSE